MPAAHEALPGSISPKAPEGDINGRLPSKNAEARVVDQHRTLHTTLAQLCDILITKDVSGILKEDTCMSTIRSNINAYTTIKEYKHDLKRVFLSKPNLHDLYQFASATLRFESQRLGENEEAQDEEEDEERIALFRPTIDGFLFTDAVPAANLGNQLLPLGVQEMVIHPTPSVEQVPTLRQTIPPPPRFPSRIHRHEDKHTVPIQWLDYGAFSSFAPTRDSNHANVSYESTYMGRAAKRFRRWEKKQRTLHQATTVKQKQQQQQQQNTTGAEIDTEWLTNQGLDADAIVAAAQAETCTMDDLLTHTTDAQLERTGELLDYLAQYQDYRFSHGNQGIDSDEQAVAEAVERNIEALLSRVAPKDIVDLTAVEAAMRRMPLRQEAYRGGLPPNKIFAYPTTERIEPVPPVATVVPGYPKERWKLVDVAGAPPTNNNRHG
ncbi:hypothetical protein BX666DRAFT_2030965 [Dichotomocladium elegans]|nr:hypothetical protein BX666DRAFT_2030965 [Dichotomocladium elegans]